MRVYNYIHIFVHKIQFPKIKLERYIPMSYMYLGKLYICESNKLKYILYAHIKLS